MLVNLLINKEFIKDDNLKSIGKKTIIITKDYQIDNSFTKFWKENGYDWIVKSVSSSLSNVDIFTYFDNKGVYLFIHKTKILIQKKLFNYFVKVLQIVY